jgi:hypothetical protein
LPWPEKDLVTRLLAAILGAVLGALLGFLVIVGCRSCTLNSPTSLVLYAAGIGAAVGFVLAFVFGDAAIRFLGRLV